MPQYTAKTEITTDRGEKLTASKSGFYNEVFNVRQEVDDATAFHTLLKGGDSIAQTAIRECKSVIIKNSGDVGAEVQIQTETWSDATPDTNGGVVYKSYLIGAGEYMYLPNFRQLGYSADTSAGNAYVLDNKAPSAINSGNLYVDTGVNLGAKIEDTDTTITVEDAGVFSVNDLIQVGINTTTATRIEIMRVTAKTAEDGETTLTVDRALYGTSAADGDAQTNSTNGAVDEANIYFPMFNAYDNNNQYSGLATASTDANGNFHIFNMFGYGRYANTVADGIVAGSFSCKFYEAGHQGLGLSNVKLGDSTGLAVSTAYQFTIAVDGATAYDLDFTTDSSDVSFRNVLKKIQDVFDTQYYTTSSNLFERKVFVGLDASGDVVFTSGQHLSTSAIALGDSSGGDADWWGVGRIPAVANVKGAVAARLPDDNIYDAKTNVSRPNKSKFAYDDGHGNIVGACTGKINYETGELLLQNAPSRADLVFSVAYGSAHSGGNEFSATTGNSLLEIAARSCNSKINTTIEIVGLN